MTEDEDKSLIDAKSEEAEKCPLMRAKRARQKRDRDDVRGGRRTLESMTFDREEARKIFVIRRRSFDY
ncbi:hypothetical protein PQR13_08925 [Paraburkholderia strydomiana]|uniref:hypothetical protein n=1 Tax=Paraburkholderia strydomiana TaxID=1245417 RepID=UPI0038B99E44